MTMWTCQTDSFAIHIGTSYPPDAALAPLDQVHGAAVYRRHAGNAAAILQADGHWSTDLNQWLGVRTADCLPVLVGIPGVVVAAVHAGWRSVQARIMNALYRQWAEAGYDLTLAQWFVGPHIHPMSFEVQEDVVQLFADRPFANEVVWRHSDGHKSVDLVAVLQLDLQADGFARPRTVRSLVGDTVRDSSLPSYRRQGQGAGRLYSSIRRVR